MIKSHLRRAVTCLLSQSTSNSIKGKSRVSFSLSALYFSTASETKPLNAPTVFEFLLHKHKFSPEVASHIDSGLSTYANNPEKFDATLSYFKEIGFTKAQLEKALRYRPPLLAASVDNILKPKMKIFQDMGFTSKDIVYIISREPGILLSSAKKKVIPSLLLLKDILGSNADVAKTLRRSGWFLMTDLRNNMVPNIKFLKSCGISTEQINVLCNYLPRFLLYKPENVKKCVEKVDQMGANRNSRMFVYAVAIVGSMANGTWELKLQAFRDILQFSEDDISRVLRSNPQVFSVSEVKMKKVKEVLLATGKYQLSSIVRFPKSLMYSIEKRYNPRLEALAILERNHQINKWPSLLQLYQMADTEFFKRYFSPLDDPVISACHRDNSMIKGGKFRSAA